MGSPVLRLILGDQLTPTMSSLVDWRAGDVMAMAEVQAEVDYAPHHKKKLVFIFAAMRAFAEEMRAEGREVLYQRLDDPNARGSLFEAVAALVAARRTEGTPFAGVVVTEPGEWRLVEDFESWSERLGVPLEVRADTRFLASRAEFDAWAQGRKELRMEWFYREMRRKTGLLMDGPTPIGGRWNFDADNRKRLPRAYAPPPRLRFAPRPQTSEVTDMVDARFAGSFGESVGFDWGVTRVDAEAARDHFIDDCLPSFGDHQDAMARGEPFLSHALLSLYLNVGLLDPLDVCQRAEAAYHAGAAPLNAVEGFIRQIIGWREYVRGVYWRFMPEYKTRNALRANGALPEFYWTGETGMRCVREVVGQTRRDAYAHHIQRLMVTGNFALLAGIAPEAVNAWYLGVYADAFEWVELPNAHGMALYADGGLLASKPYAASGAYIDRMSDYCVGCAYDVKAKTGPTACPFNVLYWDFIHRNEACLRANRRMGPIYAGLDRMAPERLAEIQSDAARLLAEFGVAKQTETLL